MQTLTRYLRLFSAFARFSLLGEMAFRGNYLLKVFVELLWLGLMLIFYRTVFGQTDKVAGWSEPEYLFFVGCYYALDGLIETFFLGNCTEFAELVRTGDLDLVLLRPIDEQFVVSFRHIDWSTAPNVLLGVGVMVYSLFELQWEFSLFRLALFPVAFACGLAMAYSFLLMLSTTAVWTVRNQSLYELWWLFTTLMRYPREIWRVSWAMPVGFFFSFVVPVLLVVNVPANVMVKVFSPGAVGAMVLVAAGLLLLSRAVFRWSLKSYRSASS